MRREQVRLREQAMECKSPVSATLLGCAERRAMMTAGLGTLVTLAKETLSRWSEDKASTLAAALAFYALFSLAPLVLIAVAVAGLVFGQRAAEGQLYSQLTGVVGEASART